MAKKQKRLKNVLLLMDPLSKLDLRWDNSLALARTLIAGQTTVWCADSGDIRLERDRCLAHAARLRTQGPEGFQSSLPQELDLATLDLVLIRKEPPFDLNYFYLTFMLEKVNAVVTVANDPRGIRNASEKLWGLLHTPQVPETMISRSPEKLFRFYQSLGSAMVVKALHEKGGRGVFLIPAGAENGEALLTTATAGGTQTVAGQKFIKASGGADKRVVLLDGKILCAFEKRPAPGEFRSNLGLGGSAHPTRLTRGEKRLVQKLAPALRRDGLYLAGLDIMGEKLLEVNVTSPAGMTDAEAVYPGKNFIAAWAAWLSQWAATAQAGQPRGRRCR